jgi:hypothetical protein
VSRQDFISQLKALGYDVQDLGQEQDLISFPYVVPVGRFRDQQITLGLEVHDDFPANCPSGPHVKPRLLPIKTSGPHPDGSIHESKQFGPEFEYWSRPYPDWAGTGRTVKSYMAHIRRLFDQ